MDKLTSRRSALVAATTLLEFVDPEGDTASLEADFTFDPADPYAVTTVFKTASGAVSWTFGRDLVIHGIYEPTGDGDVHVWPCLSSTGVAVVIFELSSPDGEVLVQAPSRDLVGFVTEMLASVPEGEESLYVDLDLALGNLLGS
ncbi:MAG: SsgA family sporulation/cell division regulator [Actinomycetota bacterium]|nr:SsgA family sporulation/cell division regulator [Actinomycetota bacterium]